MIAQKREERERYMHRRRNPVYDPVKIEQFAEWLILFLQGKLRSSDFVEWRLRILRLVSDTCGITSQLYWGESRDNARPSSLRFLSISIYPDIQCSALRSGELLVHSGSARRWGWQLWRIFFIHVTCLRARKNTFSRTEPGSNQGNRTSTYVSRPESSILKFSPSRVYVLVPFDQDRRAVVE